MPVVDYKVAYAVRPRVDSAATVLQESVREAFKEGWSLYGSMSVTFVPNRTRDMFVLVQPLMKFVMEDDKRQAVQEKERRRQQWLELKEEFENDSQV